MKHIQPTRILISKYCDEHDIDESSLDLLLEELRPIVEKHGFELSGTESYSLALEKFSICKCESCEQLFMNREENPAGFDKNYAPEVFESFIYDGGVHEGKKLCELCLPHSHRWGHSS